MLAGGMATAAMGRTPEMSPVPPGDSLAFRLIRHGSAIGTHALAFHRLPDGLDVHIGVNALVKFGPIPFVRYTHANVESWRNGRLVGLDAHTDKNGTELSMHARRDWRGLAVDGSGTAPYVAPADALPTTYWNQAMLDGPMIGTQDGGLVRPKVVDKGMEQIELASGQPIAARRYELSGDLDLVVFYDLAGVWAGMSFSVADGSVIHYQRL